MNETAPLSKTKRWYKKKWFYITLIALVVVGGGVYAQSRNKTVVPQYETARVERGSLVQTVDASGNVESADELDLRFESSGKIAKVYTTVNSEVKKGAVLADLDLGELNARIEQASAGVLQSEATLAQIRASANDAITNAEAAVEKAELNLKLSEGGMDSQIVRDAYADAVGLIIKTQTMVAAALTEADNILGIDNEFANDTYESELSIENPNNLVVARNQYLIASEDRKELDVKANKLSLTSTQTDIDAGIVATEEALVSAKDLLYKVSEVLNASVAVGRLTQTTLDSLKSGIATERSTINTQYALLITQRQEIQNAKNSYTTYSVAYAQAQKNLENAKNKAAADIAAYEASIRESRASVSASIASRNKSRIVAPIGGKVAKVAFKTGEFVTSQDVMIKLVSPRFEVKVDIPETDIVKIATGVSTTVTLDAYGSDVVFNGVVTEIESGETVIQDVVYYQVTVVLEERSDYPFLNGMTADVIFFTEKKDSALYIPQRAIKTDAGKKTVRVLENGVAVEVEIETGLRGDDGFVEILSGLEEGQEVVVRERTE